jgi:hypothetical protein
MEQVKIIAMMEGDATCAVHVAAIWKLERHLRALDARIPHDPGQVAASA